MMTDSRRGVNGKIRIGLAGLGFPNFGARTHRILEKSTDLLEVSASSLKIDLVPFHDLIENVEDSKKAAMFFLEQKIDFLLIQASSFSLGDVFYPLADVTGRIGLWFVPEPALDGELQLNSLTGFNLAVSLARKFRPDVTVKWFFGNPGDPSFDESFRTTMQALRAVVLLPGSILGQIGPIVPTFDNLSYDPGELKKNLGVEVVDIGIDTLIRKSREIPGAEKKRLVREMKNRASRVLTEEIWLEKSAGVIWAMESLKNEYGLEAAAVRCWPEFQSELNMAPCAALAFANDSGFPSGCEGDLIGALSMLVSHIVTGTAPTMNDPVAYDEKSDTIQMWHCGPGPASWADEEGQILDYHHTLNRLKKQGEPPAGLSSDIRFRHGDVTVMRIDGSGDKLFVFEAEVTDGPAKPFPGSGGWFGKLKTDKAPVSVRDFFETVSFYGIEHHYPVCRGHMENAYREMASWLNLGILPFKRWRPYMQKEKKE